MALIGAPVRAIRSLLEQLSAANNKPRAPKHLGLVNGALGLGSWGSLGGEYRLNEIGAKDIRKLRSQVQKGMKKKFRDAESLGTKIISLV